MSILGILAELEEIGLTQEKLGKAVAESPVVRAEVIRMARLAQATWREIWEESEHPYETGAYRESVQIRFEEKADEFSAVVFSKRPEAKWLEWGNSRGTKEFAPCRKTIDRLNGEQSGATSQKSRGGNVGSVGA